MSAKIIDGKKLSEKVRGEIRNKATEFFEKEGRQMGLAVILVGENPASQIYVKNKIKACEESFIHSFSYYLSEDTSEDELIDLIKKINADKAVDGVLVQLPLPKHIRQVHALSFISQEKDVDGFLAENAGNLMLGIPSLNSCTSCGIIKLIESTGESIEGKHAVVLGRSNIVGKPVALLLLEHNATVTICHSKTHNIAEITRQADILVAAVGKKEFVTADMVKDGAIVIDVGMNRHEGKLYGDVDFKNVSKIAGYITPVPDGVGPMTIAMLLSNVAKAAKKDF